MITASIRTPQTPRAGDNAQGVTGWAQTIWEKIRPIPGAALSSRMSPISPAGSSRGRRVSSGMSDYQTVTVKAIDKKSITIEVVEHSVSSRALASIFDEGESRGITDGKARAEKQDWLKIGAMLLFGEKAMSGDVELPEDGDEPAPEHLVTDVTKLEATPIGEGDSKNTRYRALLRIDVKKPKHTKLFTVGETFGAAADVGGDFEDIFG